MTTVVRGPEGARLFITASGADPEHRARMLLSIAVGALLWAMLAIAALQYVMPAEFQNAAGVSHVGVSQYRIALPVADLSRITVSQWAAWFRAALVGAWVAYAVAVCSAVRLRGRVPAWTPYLVVVSIGVFALVTPPSLSNDVYAYVGYGRMVSEYGLNPYTTALTQTARLGDQAALAAPHAVPTIYGPLWTALAGLLTAFPGGLGVHVVYFKVMAAVAAIALALLAGEVAASFDPGTRYLAVAAIGLNPLVLLEGAGNAHNDVVMMALLLGCVVLFRRGRFALAYFVLGLAAAVKFVPLLVLPWLVLEHMRSAGAPSRAKVVAVATALALAPTVLGLAAMGGAVPIADSLARVHSSLACPGSGQAAAAATPRAPDVSRGAQQRPDPTLTVLLAIVLGATVLQLKRMWVHRTPAVSAAALVVLAFGGLLLHLLPDPLQVVACLVLFGLLTYWVAVRGGPGAYLTGWSALAIFGIAITAPAPWYGIWPLSSSLTRWTWLDRGISYGVIALAAWWTLGYTRPL